MGQHIYIITNPKYDWLSKAKTDKPFTYHVDNHIRVFLDTDSDAVSLVTTCMTKRDLCNRDSDNIRLVLTAVFADNL